MYSSNFSPSASWLNSSTYWSGGSISCRHLDFCFACAFPHLQLKTIAFGKPEVGPQRRAKGGPLTLPRRVGQLRYTQRYSRKSFFATPVEQKMPGFPTICLHAPNRGCELTARP